MRKDRLTPISGFWFNAASQRRCAVFLVNSGNEGQIAANGFLEICIGFLWMALTVIPLASLIIWRPPYPVLIPAGGISRGRGCANDVGSWACRLHRIGRGMAPGFKNQRIILCPKHQSTWETFFFASSMPHPLAYVFQRELLFIPFSDGLWPV